MEATFTHPVPDDSLAVNTPLTCTELRRALASIKKVKVSTRVDTVSYRMLKEAPESVTAVKEKVVLTMYADDLAIWTDTHFRRLHTNSSWLKHSMKLFQEAVDGVVHFIQVNGFALSSQKTVFVPFHTNTSQNTEVHNQGERAEHLCIERSQVPGCTLHSLGAYEPAGRAQRAESLPSPQRDQGGICSALGEHPQDPSERGAGPGALTPVVRTGSHAPPLENGSSPSHRHRGARSATDPRAAAVRAAVPGVQRGRAPPVPPPHPARL